MDQLIPGLPDEIARECIIRIPHETFSTVRAVCRQWKQEIESPYFHFLRQKGGKTRTLIALAQAEPAAHSDDPEAKKSSANTPSYRLALFDPIDENWSCLPPVPSLPCGLPLFCQIAAVGRELVVLGGWDPDTWAASDAVHIYDFVSGTWSYGACMPGPRRSFFACAADVAQHAVYVAGGHDEEKAALRTAFKYDVDNDTWVQLDDMSRERDECKGAFIRGQFHVIGGYATSAQGRYSRSAEVFDVGLEKWGEVEEERLVSGISPRTWVAGGEGKAYVCRGGGEVVEGDGGGWRVAGLVPNDARVVPQLVAWEGKVMVMGSEMHGGAQAVYVGEEGKWLKWKKVKVPEEYGGVVHASCYFQI